MVEDIVKAGVLIGVRLEDRFAAMSGSQMSRCKGFISLARNSLELNK